MNIKTLSLSTFLLLATPTILHAEDTSLRLGTALGDHMVIQQSADLDLWGFASPGQPVNITVSWTRETIKTVSDNRGRWSVAIPVPAADRKKTIPHGIKIQCGRLVRSVSDVLIGDVWLCSGQSNMDMTIKPFLPWLMGVMHYRQEIETSDLPGIRLFDVKTNFKGTPVEECKGNWVVSSPSTAGDFSALAYLFARHIHQATGIPIGLIVSSVGGSSGQAWTSRKTLTADSLLHKKYLLPYDSSSLSREPLDSIVTFEKVVRPTLFYNAMIHPLRRLALKGVIWYQGESNRMDGMQYTRLCAAMIADWRDLFQTPDLPFYYVQVAPYHWNEAPSLTYYAAFREAQAAIRKQVARTEMAVTMDLADPNELHPPNKQDLAYRLSKIALARSYGLDSIVFRGPEFLEMASRDSVILVRFEKSSLGSGLMTSDGRQPRHFELAGADGIFHPATALIKGDELHLQSRSVMKPVHVRYAFSNAPVTNLTNQEGFPALPFRTGLTP